MKLYYKDHVSTSEFSIDKQSNVISKEFEETCDYCCLKNIQKKK